VLFSSRVRVRIRVSVWLVSGYAHVFVLLSVVILRYPGKYYLHAIHGADIISMGVDCDELTQRHQDRRSAYCSSVLQ